MKLSQHIIFQNEDLIVINKPSGLLSIPDREGKELSLKALLLQEFGQIYTVHRLDRDTSGVIIFAKNETAHKFLSQQFEDRKTEKLYNGMVIGEPAPAEGSVDAPIAPHPVKPGVMSIHRSGKQALTDYKVLESYGTYSWMEFRIHTGRTHQIRIHMKEIGYPLVADEVYGDGKPILLSALKAKFKLSKYADEQPILGRLALHAYSLGIQLPDGKIQTFTAEAPKDLRATLQQLEKIKQKKKR